MAKKLVFSAGCSVCKETIETVKRLAGSHEVVIHDMNKSEIAKKAKGYGVRSVPAVLIDGKLATCCAGRGPEEHVLRSARVWRPRRAGSGASGSRSPSVREPAALLVRSR
jgi:glutaredoxin 3